MAHIGMSPNWATIADPSVVSVASQKMGVETHSNLVAALQRNAANDTGSDGDGFAKFRLSRSLIDIEPSETRAYIALGLEILKSKRAIRPEKKHGLIPL